MVQNRGPPKTGCRVELDSDPLPGHYDAFTNYTTFKEAFLNSEILAQDAQSRTAQQTPSFMVQPPSKLDRFRWIEFLRLPAVVATLVCNDSDLVSFIYKIAVEMRVTKRPHLDAFRGKVRLVGKIRHEAR